MKINKYYTILGLLYSSLFFSQTNSVGINTKPSIANLDVDGDLKIGNAVNAVGSNAQNAEAFYCLLQNNDGLIYKVESTTASKNNFPYNYYEFNINNVDNIHITNFDTKIPTSDYTVYIVGVTLLNGSSSSAPYNVPLTSSADGTYNPLDLKAFQQDGTWRILADYPGGNSIADASNSNWLINTLIINNAVLKSFDDQEVDLKGSSTGSLQQPPSGF